MTNLCPIWKKNVYFLTSNLAFERQLLHWVYAILETVEKLKSAIDDQKITCGIFLDFSKAFDTINHHILLEKLYKYGIRGLPHAWFSSYTTNRK